MEQQEPQAILQRSEERGRGGLAVDWLDTRFCFSFADWQDRRWVHWGPLRVLNEDRIAAQQGFGAHRHSGMEIVTYVLEGAIHHRDSTGGEGVIRPGEAQRMSAGSGLTHSEWNDGHETCRLLQTWIFPDAAHKHTEPSYEARPIPEGAREEGWHVVAEGRRGRKPGQGTVTIGQDAAVLATLVKEGDRRTLDVPKGRLGFLFVVDGEVEAGPHGTLQAGDSLRFFGGAPFEARAKRGTHLFAYDLVRMADVPF